MPVYAWACLFSVRDFLCLSSALLLLRHLLLQIRGMVPHKTDRGQLAMARLSVFEGIPAPYDKQKRMVVPQALKVTKCSMF